MADIAVKFTRQELEALVRAIANVVPRPADEMVVEQAILKLWKAAKR